MESTTNRSPSCRPVVGLSGVLSLVLAVLLFFPATARAQKLDIRNKSNILLGRTQITDTATLSSKRYSFGFTNTFREGRSISNAFAGRVDPTSSTKVHVNTRRIGDETDWEMKVNQKYRSFTFDIGAGSDGLFHTGVLFGKRKGKGFGFSASWVGDDRRSGANLQLWHYVEAVDVVVALRHDRRGFGWSANTGGKMANILRGVLRYETGSGPDGSASSHQLIYGRNMRDGSNTFTGFDQLQFVPEEDVFGDDGINIRSPLYPQDDPLAWLVEGYGARFGQVELDTERLLEAELVKYVSDTVWLGGEVIMKDGLTESIDTRFGITGENLKLSASFGYAPQRERLNGSVQFRWTPFKPAPTTK